MGRPKRPRVLTAEQNLSSCENATSRQDEHREASRRGGVHGRSPGHSAFNSTKIRSSWLDDIRWVDHSPPTEMDVEGDATEVSTEEEIKSLSLQLTQVKRRLGPAADHCAEQLNTAFKYNQISARQVFEKSRRSCNPYEVLGERTRGGMNRIFVNRAAIKLANVDALLGFCLTAYDGRGPFLFADICGAPGGFSEYIMYRCHAEGVPSCRGYGMSLSGSNEHGKGAEWKLQHMSSLAGRTHSQFSVCNGADGTGDVYRWENVEALVQHIRADTTSHDCSNESISNENSDNGKVHLVVADGGFDAQRDSECQEGLAQKIIVCQAGAAVALLRLGGTLVLKLFGFRTPVIRTVMHSLFHSFQRITVVKPVSSRPASAERYAVFTGYKGSCNGWDGLTFRNNMFVGKASLDHNADCTVEMDSESKLDEYLDEVDRGILTLNLKACFDILSCLERGDQEDGTSKGRFGRMMGNAVDIQIYRKAWRLQ